MKTKKIAIAGAGVAGISIVKFLVNDKRFNENLNIDIYDAPETLGRGYAYQHDDEHLIINLPAEEMSMTADPDDFTKWLKNSEHEVESFTSRRVFGEYMHSALMSYAAEHSNINIRKSYIDNIIFNEDKKTYTLRAGENEQIYDAVFLMTGELSYSDPYELKGNSNYLYNPYPIENNLNKLEGRIGIIGSGLSAIDSFRYLLLNDHEEISVLSRSGEMPAVRGTYFDFKPEHLTVDAALQYETDGLIPLDKLLGLFKQEMEAQQVDASLFERKTDRPEIDLKYDLEHMDSVGRLQYLIVNLEDTFKTLFKCLSRRDKRTYLEKYHPYVDGNHSPMPPDGAEQILNWIDEDKLVFMHGMESVETDDGFTVTFKDGRTEHFDILINATGPVSNIEKDNTELIQNMYDALLLEADEFGGVLINKNHELISPRFGTLSNLYTIGALSAGSDYLIRGVGMLSTETEELVNHFFETNEGKI
ncbi:MAG: FAD/NAD(P)-binding protein [Jeotgalicoccus sp.]